MSENGIDMVATSDQQIVDYINSIWDHTERRAILAKGEPPAGSVVLAFGLSGTAYQRWFSDERWHGSNGKKVSWEELMELTKGHMLVATWVVPKE